MGLVMRNPFQPEHPTWCRLLKTRRQEFLVSGNDPHVRPVNIPGVVGVGVTGDKCVGIIRTHKEKRELT